MFTAPNKPAAAGKQTQQGFVYLPLIAGWLVPGAGHFLIGKWIRGALIAVSIIAMFIMGLAMQGKIYTSAQDILGLLGMAGDLGSGMLYFISRAAGWGGQPEQTTVADYGKVFIVVAGLLNIISAVDAHNLRTGRKQS